MREIILDTETTGLDPGQGHRIVEIGAVELINHIPSGRTFHVYIDPERDMPRDAREVVCIEESAHDPREEPKCPACSRNGAECK